VEQTQQQPAKAKLPDTVVNAYKSRDLILGKVTAVEKTGFTVEIEGVKAFCALNKMSEDFIHIKNSFVSRQLNFIVEDVKAGVPQVSRVAALKIENARLLDKMAREWKQHNQAFDGTILRLTDFGAFVDIGGLEGLIPISEMAWGHTENVSDIVKVGDKVKVIIIRWEKNGGRHKVSFSMKELLPNPWDSLNPQTYQNGAKLKGKLSRFIPGGAVFVFEPAIEGLLTPDEMTWDVAAVDPATIYNVGDQVEVMVTKIDRRRRQIGLSLKFPELDPWKDLDQRLKSKETHIAKVLTLNSEGAKVQIEPGIEGFLPVRLLQKAFENAYRKKTAPGTEIEVTVKKIDRGTRSLVLSLPQLATGDEDTTHFREYENERKKKSAAQSEEKLGSLGALLQAKLTGKK
jgi:small subunit ribosomal protein S1